MNNTEKIYNVEGYILNRPVQTEIDENLYQFDFKSLSIKIKGDEPREIQDIPNAFFSDIPNFLQQENLIFPLYADITFKIFLNRCWITEIKYEENENE